ncbi:hypothetical protein QML11_28450, partial [Klebsiella pneumoniae]|uniref:hypothetical protein n=1 Tax=Klebsiella pneumoniae TaxID=573 RepID=UPI003A88E9ED
QIVAFVPVQILAQKIFLNSNINNHDNRENHFLFFDRPFILSDYTFLCLHNSSIILLDKRKISKIVNKFFNSQKTKKNE